MDSEHPGITLITRERRSPVGPPAAAHRPFEHLAEHLDEPVRLVVLDHQGRRVEHHEEGDIQSTPLVRLPENRETFVLRALRHVPIGELNHVTTEALGHLPVPNRCVTLHPLLDERTQPGWLERARRYLFGPKRSRTLHRFTWGEAAREAAVGKRGLDPDTVTALPLGVDAERVRARCSPFEARRRLGLPPDPPIALVIAPGHVPTAATDRFCTLLRAHAPGAHVLRLGPRPRDPSHPREVVRPAGERPEGLVEREMPADPARLALAYRASDALVVPDPATPHPTRVLEALAAGLPCVITDRPLLRELAGEAAVVVQETSVEALAEAAGDLVNNPRRARTLVSTERDRIERADWSSTAKVLARAYDRLLEDVRANQPHPRKT